MILENQIKDSFEEDLKMLMGLTLEERELIKQVISLKRDQLSFGHIIRAILAVNPDYKGFSAPQTRKLKFLHHFIWENCSAAKAARHAGYSIKTAKQQGYRLRQELRSAFKGKQK